MERNVIMEHLLREFKSTINNYLSESREYVE